jgi:hypothetical protein
LYIAGLQSASKTTSDSSPFYSRAHKLYATGEGLGIL